MKKLIVLLLLFAVGVMAQNETWGRKIEFGNTFVTTDSLKLFEVSKTDSLYNDTLFTSAISLDGGFSEGMFGWAAYFEEVSGTSSSITLQARPGYLFMDISPTPSTTVVWGDWESLQAGGAKSTLYTGLETDSTWMKSGGDVVQLRLLEADADTVLHNVALYMR